VTIPHAHATLATQHISNTARRLQQIDGQTHKARVAGRNKEMTNDGTTYLWWCGRSGCDHSLKGFHCEPHVCTQIAYVFLSPRLSPLTIRCGAICGGALRRRSKLGGGEVEIITKGVDVIIPAIILLNRTSLRPPQNITSVYAPAQRTWWCSRIGDRSADASV
jgi:hypothetical protein